MSRLISVNMQTFVIGLLAFVSAGRAWALSDAVALQNPQIVQGSSTAHGDLAVDAAGNVYLTGSFQGTVDFNPGVGGDFRTASGTSDAFITRFNANGTYAWTTVIGGPNDGTTGDSGVALAISGNAIFMTGVVSSDTCQVNGARPGARVQRLARCLDCCVESQQRFALVGIWDEWDADLRRAKR